MNHFVQPSVDLLINFVFTISVGHVEKNAESLKCELLATFMMGLQFPPKKTTFSS